MIELIPFDESHFEHLIAWSGDPEFLLQWAGPGFTHPLDRAQLRRLLGSARAPGSALHPFTARRLADGALVGHGELGAVDRRNRSAKLLRVLVGPPSARGQGIGEQIVRELVRLGFGELALHRLELNVFASNAAAIRCYARVGFRHEGTLREARREREGYRDLCVMGLLRSEWEAG